jgi:NitT/TauT family transport system substrate-binding protein
MKKLTSLILALLMALTLLSGCGEKKPGEMNVYVLAGPTGIGAMNLWSASDAGTTKNTYHFTMTGANDEVVAAISNGSADIAAVATNLAATLYNKTEGVTVLAVNTLGVLSLLDNSGTVSSVADLKGKTIYAPGQGANPEYILRYVLTGNGLDPDADVTLRFVGEGSELLSVWATDPEAVIMAPQPVATTILMKNPDATTVCDMSDAWSAIAGSDSALMMGCVIVRNEYLAANPDAVELFMEEYKASVEQAQSDVSGTAALCESYGLIAKAAVAEKAIPSCGLTFVSGAELKTQLSGYFQVMFDANPKSIGGAMPADAFYYHA